MDGDDTAKKKVEKIFFHNLAPSEQCKWELPILELLVSTPPPGHE
jgi:hypothetical protein